MTKKIHLIVLGAALLVGAAFVAASAFTTATLSRDANIDVVADPSGIIGLDEGNATTGLVYLGSDGELKIDFDPNNNNLGVNTNSTYEIGDPSDARPFAFNVTNNDNVQHTIELNYTTDLAQPVDGYDNAQFTVFQSGSLVGTTSEDSGPVSATVSSGGSLEVVVVIDTLNANVDNSTSLSGTLNVTAT